jgi:hypothetical protein
VVGTVIYVMVTVIFGIVSVILYNYGLHEKLISIIITYLVQIKAFLYDQYDRK